MRAPSLVSSVREAYEGDTETARSFRYGLLIADFAIIVYIVVTSFLPDNSIFRTLDLAIGIVLIAEFSARIYVARNRWQQLVNPVAFAEIVALLSFLLAPFFGPGFEFLRVLRTLRILHTYQMVARLAQDFPWFDRARDVVFSTVHLGVFLFVMSGIVYTTQFSRNPDINNYVDALYFTVTSLTTTGYGDILLSGTGGRLLSVVIMIAGVTLFLRLVRALIQPAKIRYECPTCGLQRHDLDSVHCKHCGTLLHIPTEGL